MWYGNYLHFFEKARMEILRNFNLLPHLMSDEGIICPIIDINVQYKSSARCDDELVIRGGIKENPTATLDFIFEVYRKRDMQLLVTGTTRQAFTQLNGTMLFYIPESLKGRILEMTEYFKD
jgi:acyl-CoA thioester hydrolase